ncbi:MAG TPA: LysR family transcriptional regulator [Spongiibacteraceae bacterium]|jgi:DNA-binding transcriptional LysR family regulator|nr:LysR family transcriptional regulator [Spongiibacteraceae bacterium]
MRTNQYIGLMPYMATFVKVVECGSFSAAATRLGITTSAVSRQVACLEEAISVKLLERTTRKLRLTEAGNEAYARCRHLVESCQAVMEVGSQFNSSPKGIVKLSVPKAFGRKVIAPHIPEFLRRYPDISVQLILTDNAVDLISDDIDLMIRITDMPPLGLAARPLMTVSHVLCATEEYLSLFGTPEHPSDLSLHSCLYLGETATDNRWQLRNKITNHCVTINVQGRYVTNHSEVRLDGVLANLGIGCLPLFTAQQALNESRILQVLPEWHYITSYCGKAWILYQPNRYLSPKCRVLIDYLFTKIAEPDEFFPSRDIDPCPQG